MTVCEFTIAVARETWPLLALGTVGTILAVRDLYRHRKNRHSKVYRLRT